jgi:hypothetical protein
MSIITFVVGFVLGFAMGQLIGVGEVVTYVKKLFNKE